MAAVHGHHYNHHYVEIPQQLQEPQQPEQVQSMPLLWKRCTVAASMALFATALAYTGYKTIDLINSGTQCAAISPFLTAAGVCLFGLSCTVALNGISYLARGKLYDLDRCLLPPTFAASSAYFGYLGFQFARVTHADDFATYAGNFLLAPVMFLCSSIMGLNGIGYLVRRRSLGAEQNFPERLPPRGRRRSAPAI